ncbi:MAG: tRNA pseudouridine(55) synthase TruB [Coprococcus sp.]|nr:tRNA pseudouridine(55) synthase TruB [Coprococcus sp.]
MIHGVLNIYKEKGYTSHDVVAKLRRITGQKKIGHTGTLDPDAEGVLPVCLGRATKLCDMLTDKDKTYEAVLLLGRETDTQDISGEILKEQSTDHLTDGLIRRVILSFEGEQEQIPPMFSALKVGGKRLYELAREGKVVERKPRKVTIHSIRILEMELPRVRMEVACSKGTYIRTLCHDIGGKLGCGGCMETLLRTRVERFLHKDALRLCEVEILMQEGKLGERVTPIDAMFPRYKKVYLESHAAWAVRNGNRFSQAELTRIENFQDGEHVLVYDKEQNFIAVYEFLADEKEFQIVRMFFDRADQESR